MRMENIRDVSCVGEEKNSRGLIKSYDDIRL